jgi:hypothetical protein
MLEATKKEFARLTGKCAALVTLDEEPSDQETAALVEAFGELCRKDASVSNPFGSGDSHGLAALRDRLAQIHERQEALTKVLGAQGDGMSGGARGQKLRELAGEADYLTRLIRAVEAEEREE